MNDKGKFANDIVISTRIRLARNIKNIPFPFRTDEEQALTVKENIVNALTHNNRIKSDRFKYVDMKDLTEIQRLSLVERHLISPDLGSNSYSGALINKDETLSVMVNEEDHIRIQCILPGFTLMEGYETANRLDDHIQEMIDYSFSDKYGFITSCPTNVGTGMRAGVMLHIPAIVLKGELNLAVTMANKYGLTVRGIYGEGSSALGDLFQISNQNSLGLSEDEIIKNLHAVSKEIIKMERAYRNEMLIKDEDEIKDRVGRAYGLLTNAHMISTQEAMKLLSILRMGIDINLIGNISAETLNRLMIDIQPATLSILYKLESDNKKRDTYRAEYIQDILKNKKQEA